MPDDPTEANKQVAEQEAAADMAEAEKAAAAKAEQEKLGDGGKAALDAERKAKRDAEKRATAAEAKLKEREEADLSEQEKLKKRAEEAEGKVTTATEKIRRANLLTALADDGLTGARAKAAARLLDDVEYDDTTDEPTNLQDAIKAATAEYGEEMFKGATPKPKPSNIDSGSGTEDRDGPSLTAEQLQAAKACGMTPEEYVNFSGKEPKLPDKPQK